MFFAHSSAGQDANQAAEGALRQFAMEMREDTSTGADEQIYMAHPELAHAPYAVEVHPAAPQVDLLPTKPKPPVPRINPRVPRDPEEQTRERAQLLMRQAREKAAAQAKEKAAAQPGEKPPANKRPLPLPVVLRPSPKYVDPDEKPG